MQPLEAFFRSYGWFTYVHGQSASAQFHRLRDEAGWGRGDDENDRAWMSYRTALVRQFNMAYSADENDLAAWHALLRHIGINNPPSTVAECKSLIRGKLINLIDLIDARDDPDVKIVHFATEEQLSAYTLSEKKIFPRNHDEAGTLLRYLLRNIMNPDPNRRDPAQIKKQKERRDVAQKKKGRRDPAQKKKGSHNPAQAQVKKKKREVKKKKKEVKKKKGGKLSSGRQ